MFGELDKFLCNSFATLDGLDVIELIVLNKIHRHYFAQFFLVFSGVLVTEWKEEKLAEAYYGKVHLLVGDKDRVCCFQ